MDVVWVRGLFDRQMRRGAGVEAGGSGRMERGGGVVRQVGGAVHEWNGVLWSDVDEVSADDAIAAQLRWLASPEGAGREFEWKLYAHDRPADLGDRLLAAGFTPEPPETLMVAETRTLLLSAGLTDADATAPPHLAAPRKAGTPPEANPLPDPVRLPDSVRLEAVTDARGVRLLAEAHEAAFGSGGARLRARLLDRVERGDGRLSMVVALAGEVPVSGARMELHPGTDFASLWGGGTAPAWRGRGIYRALIAHRARIAAARGYRYLQVDASEQSRPILERLGFAALSVTTPYLKRA